MAWVAYGGDEPFYAPWQRQLPMEAQETLLPDPGPLRLMRHHPWGAAPAMALTAGSRSTGDHGLRHRRRRGGGTVSTRWRRPFARPPSARTGWRRDGYYAAAQSTVDGQLYRLPHLPTALAPLLTGYATRDDPHARDGAGRSAQLSAGHHRSPGRWRRTCHSFPAVCSVICSPD